MPSAKEVTPVKLTDNQVLRVVALFGNKRTGKTPTLKKLIELLTVAGGEIIQRKNNGEKDCSVCFKYNRFTVTVVTGGDNENDIEQAFEFATQCNSDFLFCACRKRESSSSRMALNKLANEQGVHVLYVSRTVEAVETNQDKVNRQQAAELLNMIA